ncbi:MAG: hypothetical protein JNK82_14075 [Myxococcaceae bacterium]|nr:hypothetical protein [Myxococcaceae bacterium]
MLVVASGCTNRTAEPPCPSDAIADIIPFFERGVPYQARIGTRVFVCTGRPAWFTAELVDENNQPVDDVEWELVNETAPFVELRFTPQGSGPYHYRVVFQPNLAVSQGVLVGAVRRPHTVLATIPLRASTTCRGQATARGSLVCRDRATTSLLHAGEPEVTLSGWASSRAVVAGDVIWLTSPMGQHRYVDTAGGLVQEPANPSPLLDSVLAASESTGFSAISDRVIRFELDGGGWSTLEFRLPENVPPIEGDSTELVSPAALGPDAGWWWAASNDGYCQVPVAPDGGLRCFPAAGNPHTIEPERVWFSAGGATGYVDIEGRVVSSAIGTARGRAPVFIDHPGRVAILRVEADGGLTCEHIDGEYASGWVQGERLYLISDAGVTVMTR